MKSVMRAALVFALMAVVSVSFGQDEAKKGKKKRAAREPQAIVAVQKSLAKIELTDEQKAKVDKLFAGAKEELTSVNKARVELLGQGGQGKLAAARKKANAEGKKGKELQAALKEALGLDDEKFAKYNELAKKNRGVTQGLRKAVAALLTPEQVKEAGLGPQKRGRKKDAAADADAKVPNLKDPAKKSQKVDAKVPDLKDPTKTSEKVDAKVPEPSIDPNKPAKKNKKNKEEKKEEKKEDKKEEKKEEKKEDK